MVFHFPSDSNGKKIADTLELIVNEQVTKEELKIVSDHLGSSELQQELCGKFCVWYKKFRVM
jgi:hypothetical protein